MKKILIILTSLLVSLSSFAQVKYECPFSKSNFQVAGVAVGATGLCEDVFTTTPPEMPRHMFSRGVRVGSFYLDRASAQKFYDFVIDGDRIIGDRIRSYYDLTRVGFLLGSLNFGDKFFISPSVNYAWAKSAIGLKSGKDIDSAVVNYLQDKYGKGIAPAVVDSLQDKSIQNVNSIGIGLDFLVRVGKASIETGIRASKFDITTNVGVLLPLNF